MSCKAQFVHAKRGLCAITSQTWKNILARLNVSITIKTFQNGTQSSEIYLSVLMVLLYLLKRFWLSRSSLNQQLTSKQQKHSIVDVSATSFKFICNSIQQPQQRSLSSPLSFRFDPTGQRHYLLRHCCVTVTFVISNSSSSIFTPTFSVMKPV